MLRSLTLASFSLLVACGDDGGSTPTKDAPVETSLVEAINCAGNEPEVTAVNGTNAYTPDTVTVPVDGVVKFTMPSTHNVVPDPGNDAGLKVGFSETKCLKFTAAGQYKFHCGPHSFKGTVNVQ